MSVRVRFIRRHQNTDANRMLYSVRVRPRHYYHRLFTMAALLPCDPENRFWFAKLIVIDTYINGSFRRQHGEIRTGIN